MKTKPKKHRNGLPVVPVTPSASFAQIITALDLGIERLENDFYDTQAEAWTDYGAQYAHERILWAFRELEKKTAKKKGGAK